MTTGSSAAFHLGSFHVTAPGVWSQPFGSSAWHHGPWPPFPLGQWKDGVLATSELVKGPVPAASGADASPAGCLHMGGNVSEWVEVGAAPGVAAFVGTRGGNWFYGRRAADVTGTRAKKWDPSFRADTIGFRCAVDASKVQP